MGILIKFYEVLSPNCNYTVRIGSTDKEITWWHGTYLRTISPHPLNTIVSVIRMLIT